MTHRVADERQGTPHGRPIRASQHRKPAPTPAHSGPPVDHRQSSHDPPGSVHLLLLSSARPPRLSSHSQAAPHIPAGSGLPGNPKAPLSARRSPVSHLQAPPPIYAPAAVTSIWQRSPGPPSRPGLFTASIQCRHQLRSTRATRPQGRKGHKDHKSRGGRVSIQPPRKPPKYSPAPGTEKSPGAALRGCSNRRSACAFQQRASQPGLPLRARISGASPGHGPLPYPTWRQGPHGSTPRSATISVAL
ncbi:hypothetical protein NDU88_002946 [Pleurodeles waltl]|uniref:Uncharacterized protein n=1 Tax=Pleurodeles waltl TaxID=8319 RepID=A0AAV7TM29_PLEWA|nr:hypothetical protein NDU88_002946 [Pleurodeles waltl]